MSIVVVGLMILTASYFLVSLKGRPGMYYEIEDVSNFQYGLVLGTSRHLRSGSQNPFFQNRIEAAARLYEAGKIEKILLSGDFSPPYYNEPGDMKKALTSMGIPEIDLVLDPYGFRTYSSVIRAHNVFHLDSFLIISQAFHAQRAIFIAKERKIHAKAFIADDPELHVRWVHSPYFREIFARVRSIWDCYFIEPVVDTEKGKD